VLHKALFHGQTINGSPVSQGQNLSAYDNITDKLNANVELLAGYNGADQTGNVFDAEFDLADAAAAIWSYIKTVVDRQRAIYIQIDLMKVMGLNAADFATLGENRQAVKDFLGAHLRRLVDVQNTDVESLVVDLKRVTNDERRMRMNVDTRKLFGWAAAEARRVVGG
jgi:hypothetical protein